MTHIGLGIADGGAIVMTFGKFVVCFFVALCYTAQISGLFCVCSKQIELCLIDHLIALFCWHRLIVDDVRFHIGQCFGGGADFSVMLYLLLL